jgi:hypothetical protein
LRPARREFINVAAAEIRLKQILCLRAGGNQQDRSHTDRSTKCRTRGPKGGFELRYHEAAPHKNFNDKKDSVVNIFFGVSATATTGFVGESRWKSS